MIQTDNPLHRIPEMASLPYHRKLIAQSLIERGADVALLLFWFNLITQAYSHFPIHCVMSDVVTYMQRYPAFAEDITNWFQTFESANNQLKPMHDGKS